MKKFQVNHGDQMIIREAKTAAQAAMAGHLFFNKDPYAIDRSMNVSTAHADDNAYEITSPSSEVHFTYWVYEIPEE